MKMRGMFEKTIFTIGMTLISSVPLFAMEFIADSRIVAAGKVTESKFIYAGDKWRMEEQHPEGRRIIIFRQDKKSLYMLWPDKKRYVIQPLPEKEFRIISSRQPGEEIERINLGEQTLSGFLTMKSRVKYNIQSKTLTSVEWFSTELGVVIRSETEDKVYVSELLNIKKVACDDKLFDAPGDYQPLAAKDVVKSQKQNSKQ